MSDNEENKSEGGIMTLFKKLSASGGKEGTILGEAEDSIKQIAGEEVPMLKKIKGMASMFLPSVLQDIAKELKDGKYIVIIKMNEQTGNPIFMVLEKSGITEFKFNEDAIKQAGNIEDFMKEKLNEIPG